MGMDARKYRPYPPVRLPDRTWPDRVIRHAPRWCSVDLRDGNQALVTPMDAAGKKEMFRLLTGMGFREIEVGFPSASRTEHDFLRMLADEDLIPGGVTVQVLTQAREHLIRKTFESLRGVRRAVVHLYNSTSELQRRVVFRMDRKEILRLAVEGAALIREEAGRLAGSDITFEYSPESFTGTELDFSLEICEAVAEVWAASPERKVILNLPATVEMATPNVYADQIEWFCRNMKRRDCVIISTHAHNDRGTAVAATELALMAGADRVEGTLFGNGERTGNVDILTLGLNLFSQGIDPGLDFSRINEVIGVYERCTGMSVHSRHPYAGDLVYTAFSGSHQDAINKGMKACGGDGRWEVPYLPIDPADVGRTYESIIRINSQSGKGGVAYVMEKEFGFSLPKGMHPEFGRVIQGISDRTGAEVMPAMIREAFEREYLASRAPYELGSCQKMEVEHDTTAGPVSGSRVKAVVRINGAEREITGGGNGPIDAFANAMQAVGIGFRLTSYYEHALAQGSDSRAVAYIEIEDGTGRRFWGAGIDTDIDVASFRAILSGLNRAGRTA